MQTKIGKDRLVLVFPMLGFVVKFAIIRVRKVLREIITQLRSGSRKSITIVCFRWLPESKFVISGLIFRGIVANRRERALWKRTHNPFLQPTLLSIFGLINVQRYGKPYQGLYIDLWDQVRRITRWEAYQNPHQFSKPDNYCVVNGRLRILDYGGPGSTWVVLKHGKRIVDEFDFSFRYADTVKSSE